MRSSSSQVAGPTLGLTSRHLPQEFFHNGVLAMSSGLGEIGWGTPAWFLALCLTVTWTINFLCLFKVLSPGLRPITLGLQGVKTSGKVVYFTAIFPYIVIVILLVKAATLEGAMKGIKFYLSPKWEKLGEFKVWVAAANQILFSLSNANATMPTLASYNPFHKNIIFVVFFVSILNCLTSFVAGFAVFGTLGYLATVMEQEVADVGHGGGPGLAFIAYPDLVRLPAVYPPCPCLQVGSLPLPQLWSVLFFFMLVTLGLDSSMCLVEAVSTFLVDSAPRLRARKTLVTLSVCLLFLLCSLPLASTAGRCGPAPG
jgi:SNF family Na+-dependent transporter